MEANIDITVDDAEGLVKTLGKILNDIIAHRDNIGTFGASFSSIDEDGNCHHVVIKVKNIEEDKEMKE